MDLPGLMEAIQAFLQDQLDGAEGVRLTLDLKNRDPFTTPIFLPRQKRYEQPTQRQEAAPVQRAAERVVEEDVFVPNDFQAEILGALEFKALRSDALVDALGCDRRKLWKPNGIKELVTRGWVKLDTTKRLGYYRPDAPPDELEEVEEA